MEGWTKEASETAWMQWMSGEQSKYHHHIGVEGGWIEILLIHVSPLMARGKQRMPQGWCRCRRKKKRRTGYKTGTAGDTAFECSEQKAAPFASEMEKMNNDIRPDCEA